MRKLLENNVLRFLIIAGGLYVLWLIVYYFFIQKYTTWDYALNYNIVLSTKSFLDFMGFGAQMELESEHVLLVLNEGSFQPIWVGDECNGFKLFSIYSIFIIAFPGNWKKKLWFIPMGIGIIHIANILRTAALVYIATFHEAYLDFNHNYTFTILVYSIIFLLWYWYAKKFSDYAEAN